MIIGRDVVVGPRQPINPDLAFGVSPELAALRPGDLVTYKYGERTFTEHWNPEPEPVVYPTLTRWQRIARKLTPPRWRKPLLPIRTDPAARYQRMMTNILDAYNELMKP